jgi:DNA repair exonuclease SbcCD nuclease subunit
MTEITLDEINGDSFLAIGDIHFKDSNTEESIEFSHKLLTYIDKIKNNLSFVVILGDTLHYHGALRVLILNLAVKLIKEIYLKKIHVILLIGNHDMHDPNQFQSTNHAFFTLKGVNRYMHVIDQAKKINFKERKYVFVPYVPKGRFTSALETLSEKKINWKDVDAIFAHQEFRGTNMDNGKASSDGDKWHDDYPPIISGHIHTPQKVGDNIFYLGSSIQGSYKEQPVKGIWFVSCGNDQKKRINEDIGYEIVDLGMKRKTLVTVPLSKAKDVKVDKKDKTFVEVKGSYEEFVTFQRSEEHKKLSGDGVTFIFLDTTKASDRLKESKFSTFEENFQSIMDKKDERTKKMLKELMKD